MSRTERVQISVQRISEAPGSDYRFVINPNGRDEKPRCWCCSGWKRSDRRQSRQRAKAALRRDPEGA